MLFIWLLFSAALTLLTGMRPPRMTAQPAERLNRPVAAQQRAMAEPPIGAEPTNGAGQMPVADGQSAAADMSGALVLSGGRRTQGRADPETASLAANADG